MPFVTLEDITSSRDAAKWRFDFIIVGAGSAGCPLASRLSEDRSVTVLLIEAGPCHQKSTTLETRINVAVPAGAGKLQHNSSVDWQYYAEPQHPICCQKINTFAEGAKRGLASRSYWPRWKGLGGSSLINYMAWVRGHANDYNLWEKHFDCPGWGWNTTSTTDTTKGGGKGGMGIEQLFQERIEDVTEGDSSLLCPKCRKTTKKGPYGISHKAPANSLATTFVEACQSLGYSKGDYNCFCQHSSKNQDATTSNSGIAGLHQLSVRQGTRCHAARAYLDPLLLGKTKHKRPNLFVLTGANCREVVLEPIENENGSTYKAAGVQLVPDNDKMNGDPIVVYCDKEIILSAGALGSPQILLQSGIGDSERTAKSSSSSRTALVESPQVGRNLQDHLVTFLRFPPRLGQGNQDIGTITIDKAEGWKSILANLHQLLLHSRGILTSASYDASLFCSSGITNNQMPSWSRDRPDLQVSAMCSTADLHLLQGCIGLDFDEFELEEAEFKPTAEGMSFCCTLLHPESRGYVELQGNNELAIHANYLTDKDNLDLKRIIAAIRLAIRIAHSEPFHELLDKMPRWPKDLCRKYNIPFDDPNQVVQADDYPEAFLEEYVRRYATTLYHPTSTCRMGRGPSEAVVDSRLRVFGVKNLRVVDASIQPLIVSANTQASCVVIGEKAVDIIREDYNMISNPEELMVAVEDYERSIAWKRRIGWTAFTAMVGFAVFSFMSSIANQ